MVLLTMFDVEGAVALCDGCGFEDTGPSGVVDVITESLWLTCMFNVHLL